MAQTKSKTIYVCSECGAQASKWSGQCFECNSWNTLSEQVAVRSSNKRLSGYAGEVHNGVVELDAVPATATERTATGIKELDRVLGGGMVPGSVVLLGGDPGIGKSTLLLQTICKVAQKSKVLYVTGEESLSQVKLRADRLGLPTQGVRLLAETQLERLLSFAKKEAPKILVVDSIQTIYTEHLSSAPGSVSQVRESAALLVRYAKQTQTLVFIVGHVTKEGILAGPRVLEHMVDTVLYFEGQSSSTFRMVRAVKNRYGAVNELGMFAMMDDGLREVSNPSAIFLSNSMHRAPGSVVVISWEGTRPLLVEVQALVDQSHLPTPRRICLGLDAGRLAMLLAVLSRHGQVSTHDRDVFINVVGGVKITETGVDLAVVLAVLSSLQDRLLPSDLAVFGELGLAGEIRPVQSGQVRIKEAIKQGFNTLIAPKKNIPKTTVGIKVFAVNSLREAIDALQEIRSDA